MPTKKTTQKLVPELRFPEFRNMEGWEDRPLGHICEIKTGKKDANQGNPKGEYPFFTCAEHHTYSDSYSFDCEAILIAGNANVGQAKYYNGRFEAYQRTYVLLDFSDIQVDFLFTVLDSTLRPALQSQMQTSAMSYIKLPMLKEFSVCVPPSKPEQEKIADCLGSLDELLAAHRRKLASLQDHKKGLLQQLFPAEGQTTPNLRFPGFEGEWEVMRISELGKVVTGNTPSTKRSDFYKGSKLFVSPADISETRLVEKTNTTLTDLGFAQTRKIPPHSILFVCIGSTIGKIAQNLEECATNQQINAIIPDSNNENGFVYFCLSRHAGTIAQMAANQAVPIINKTLFSSFEILIPYPPEQQKIADCLSALDALITAQTDQIAALQAHKNGLMQKLFPNPEAVA